MANRYDRLKAQGLCIACGHVAVSGPSSRCRACQIAQAGYSAKWLAKQRDTDAYRAHAAMEAQHEAFRQAQPPEDPRNLVAHCGQWWPVTGLPLVLPCCGVTLREEAP